MTSRNTTPILTLRGAVEVEREPADWMWLLGMGAVQWPWLLKSLYGGRKTDKAALLKRLGLAPDALPNLGSWKADTGLLTLITDLILARRPQMIVELGAGASSLVAARALQMAGGGRMISFDQHDDFVVATRDWLADNNIHADIRHGPLVSQSGRWQDLWYDLDGLPDQIDLLLIDGPPWTIHPKIRGHAARLFDRIAVGGTVILDDAARPGERLVAAQWRRDWPSFDWQFVGGIKGTLIGVRHL
jgi:predicted O-methyltransferase YrrM